MNKTRKIIIPLSIIILIIFTLHSYTSAYDDKITHPSITEVASSKRPYLNDYLINNLEISEGVQAVINEKPIIEWLMDGSRDEDLPWQ